MHHIILFVMGIVTCLTVNMALAEGDQGKQEDTMLLGFEKGDLGKTPSKWFVPTTGWKVELSEAHAADGKRSAKLFLPGDSDAPFGNLMRSFDVDQYRGKHVRLAAKIRVEGDKGRAQMWLRVDRPNRQLGFFDNMSDRPIQAAAWTEAVIEGDIDADANGMVCGIISFGNATVYIDDMQLTVSSDVTPTQEASPPKTLTDRGLENLRAATRLLSYIRFFHPSDETLSVIAWDHFAVELMATAEPAKDATELADRLTRQFAPIAPGLEIWEGHKDDISRTPTIPDGTTSFRYWVHHGAGRVAMNHSIYSSQTRTIKREELGRDPETTGGLFNKLATLVKKDDSHHRPKQPFVTSSLGGGVLCRIPILVAVGSDGSLPTATEENRWDATAIQPALTATNRSTRLAGVAICWGVMQHFYPYFDVVDTDWDATLDSALRGAAEDKDEASYLQTLQKMVALLHDGHGNVYASGSRPTSRLPVDLAWAGDHCAVVGMHDSVPGKVEVGDVIVTMDGERFLDRCEELSSRISAATDGFRRTVLLRLLVFRDDADPCELQLRKPDGSEYNVALPLVGLGQPIERKSKNPGNGAELAEGIVYFDLNGAEDPALEKSFATLQQSHGIVFDLRGYPGSAAKTLMHHLIDQRAASAQWHVPVVTLPDRKEWTWQQSAWDMQPSDTPLDAEIAFLTDGRAISYAESIMGIVEHYHLGEIVGATTAGTNGNVNPFALPGGYRVSWTGMKVLKHDGSRHHGVGIRPTIPVEPTVTGIAAGRDEVLERAVEVIKKRIGDKE